MTLLEIEQRLKQISASAFDPESAHGLQDKLLWDFVAHVSRQPHITLAKQAKAVLKARDISFPRCYA
jgi:hypothetical protein